MTQRKDEEKLICVWLDNQLMRSEDYIDTQDQLRTITKDFVTFSNSNHCVDFITNTTDAKIFLITSHVLGKIIVPVIHTFEQIHSIYIFSTKKSLNDEWTKDYKKIKRVFNDITLICDQFKQDTTITATKTPTTTITKDENDFVAISFVSSKDISSHDVNRQDPSFMYFQLLKDIILNDSLLESEEQTKTDMIDYCRKVYTDCPNTIVVLDEFEKGFIPELSIYWYTKECFLYKMLNKALWTPQPDVLYKLRYFIRHLHHQILSEASKQREHLSSMTVYRGQNMAADQVEKLKQNVGGFLSFNNFLSTSLKQDVALNFLLGSDISVLFEMQIDPTIQKFPIINIENISYLQKDECEQELLFAMGSVFRIIRVEKEKDFYRVRLTLSDNIDEQLAAYTKVTRDQTRAFNCFLSLVKLMDALGQYNCVDRFAEMVDDDTGLAGNPLILGAVHHMFGLIYLNREQYKESLEHSQKALSINLSFLPADSQMLTPTYNNIGCVYLAQGDYAKALEYQQLALDCQLNSDNPDLSAIILYTNNVGKIYGHQKKYSEAIERHERALELQIQYLGEKDPSLRDTYNLMSTMYLKQGDVTKAGVCRGKAAGLQEITSGLDPTASADSSIKAGTNCLSRKQYQEAMTHFKRGLEIQQQYLLPNHPSLAKTYDRIAKTYYDQDCFEEALQYYQKGLEVEQSSLSNDHSSIATSYFNIATCYVGLSRWSDALEYAFKAVEQLKKTLHSDVNTLASFVHYIGYIFHEQKKYEEAIIYYQEALELYQTHLTEDDPSLFVVYHRAGRVYYQLDMYTEALIVYQKTLNIASKILPDNSNQIAYIYNDLSMTYVGLKQYDESMIAAEQAIEQLCKTLPNNHPDVAEYRVRLDVVKQKQISENGYLWK